MNGLDSTRYLFAPFTFTVLWSVLQPAIAQELWHIKRLDGPIALDGQSDEAAWHDIDPLPLTMNYPTFQGEFTERTEIRVAYDNEYIYAAGRFYDSDPDGIRGNSLTRDNPSESDDYFVFLLDTFNDNENALVFMTTPAGIRIDQTVFNDAQITGMEPPINESWNTFWDVATDLTDEGWFAEMRIPISSIRFQDNDGQVTMGLMTWRWIGRKSEGHSFPETPPKWYLSYLKPSIMQDVVFDDMYSRKPVYITPYGLGGMGRYEELDTDETAYIQDNDNTFDLGLDVKYGLTSNLTLDLTVNTDFAQVEADDQQVNLTRFSLFFPEKRLFFQERASIFEFNTGDFSRLFYSRRIGLSEDGPVRIYGGARIVGRVGPWDMGFLNMQTARFDEIPSENFGVLRMRRQVFNENSYVGGMVTSRMGQGGSYDMAYGLDGVIRLFGDDYFSYSLAHTFNDSLAGINDVSLLKSGLARFVWERRRNQGLGYVFSAKTSGEEYDPGVGFVLRNDVTQLNGEISYGMLGPERSRLFQQTIGLTGESFFHNDDGSLETLEVGAEYILLLRSGSFFYFSPQVTHEDLREPFELSDDAVVPAGSYTFYGITSMHQPAPRLFRTGYLMQAGSFYDGWRISIGLMPTWTISQHLELSGEYEFNRVRFPDRDQQFNADIFRLRAKSALNTHLSATVFAQYNNYTDVVVVNFRLRYNFKEGNDLYIVYNEGLNTDRYAADPFLPLTDNRTILVKYTYTFLL